MIYFTETYTMTVESIAPCYVPRAETQAQDSCGSKTLECTLQVSKINLNTQTRGARNLVHPLPTSLGKSMFYYYSMIALQGYLHLAL